MRNFSMLFIGLGLLGGCASVPMESTERSAMAKQFNLPDPTSSGIYIYRSGSLGGGLKKDIWIDGKCIGETAPDIFFYEKVQGGISHKIATESEFSPNELELTTEGGKNYFIRQYIKLGVFVGGANLELVSEETGKKSISDLKLAKQGVCSK